MNNTKMRDWEVKTFSSQRKGWGAGRPRVLNLCQECGTLAEDAVDRRNDSMPMKGFFCQKCYEVLTSVRSGLTPVFYDDGSPMFKYGKRVYVRKGDDTYLLVDENGEPILPDDSSYNVHVHPIIKP